MHHIARAMQPLLDHYMFASDAERLAIWGGVFLVLALAALAMEKRRQRRVTIDRIGWVPWTGLFLTLMVVGGGLLAVAVPSLLKS